MSSDDRTLILSAMTSGLAVWRPISEWPNHGHLHINGEQYVTGLDDEGCPMLNLHIRGALRRAKGFDLGTDTDNPDVKRIPLQDGSFALVSRCDFESVIKHVWRTAKNRHLVYAWRSATDEDRLRGILAPNIYMHRHILEPAENKQVDHVNGNGLDNRRENLRECDSVQNHGNSRHRVGKSGYRGVKPARHGSGFQARMSIKNKFFNIGHFRSAEEAAAAYDRAAIERFGEFAMTNERMRREAQREQRG
jgi:hypothetical protein